MLESKATSLGGSRGGAPGSREDQTGRRRDGLRPLGEHNKGGLLRKGEVRPRWAWELGEQGTPRQRPQDYGREEGRLAGARVVEGPCLRIFPGQLSVTKAQEWREEEATKV